MPEPSIRVGEKIKKFTPPNDLSSSIWVDCVVTGDPFPIIAVPHEF